MESTHASSQGGHIYHSAILVQVRGGKYRAPSRIKSVYDVLLLNRANSMTKLVFYLSPRHDNCLYISLVVNTREET